MTALTLPVTLTPLLGLPEVQAGDDVAGVVLKALRHNDIHLMTGDILVISSKVASKAMGLRAPAADLADVVRSQTVRVVAERGTPMGVARIVESAAGPVMASAGVDASNTADESSVLLLPADPDSAAASIRSGVQNGWEKISGEGVHVGVILSDTAGRPWRIGQVDFALGAAGVHVVDDLRGATDADGRVLAVTERCIADEIASAADLVKGKVTGIPAAHIRGLGQHVQDGQDGRDVTDVKDPGESLSGARGIIRTGPADWFGYGAAEAVRAALGVEPGSPSASAVGIPSASVEDIGTRARRALRVALLTCPTASGRVDGETIRMYAADDFALGVAATRAEVALRGEGLTATLTALTRMPAESPPAEADWTDQSRLLIVFR